MQFQIRLLTANLPDIRFYLRGPGPYFLGSSLDCTIPIQARGVSRRHLELYFDNFGTLHFRDLDSTNGTLLNGQRCSGAPLREGYLLQIGQSAVRIEGTTTEFLGYQPELEKLKLSSLMEIRGQFEHDGRCQPDEPIPWLDISTMVKDFAPPFQRSQLWEHFCRWFVRITGSNAAKCFSIRPDGIAVNAIIGEFPEGLISNSIVKSCMQIPFAATFHLNEDTSSSQLFSLPMRFEKERALFFGQLSKDRDPIHYEPERLLALPAIFRFILSWVEALEAQKATADYLNRQLQEIKSGGVANDKISDPIIGESRPLLNALEKAAQAAQTDMTVLVIGETGVGKELVSRRIHHLSARCNGPFIPVNCAAIPASLLESELFGAEKGAYTSLDRTRIGKIEAAQGGTLFLDEIADMSRDVQAVLLRFLEDKKITPLGSSVERKIDVRLIAATNRPLRDLQDPQVLRPDLYFRLTPMIVEVPPLRQRGNDIFLLAMAFLSTANREFGRSAAAFTEEAIELLKRYPWPGNVRELMGVVKGLVLHSQANSILSSKEVEQALGKHNVGYEYKEEALWEQPLEEARLAFEKEYFMRRLAKPYDSLSALARSVGLARPNLYLKLRKLGLKPSD